MFCVKCKREFTYGANGLYFIFYYYDYVFSISLCERCTLFINEEKIQSLIKKYSKRYTIRLLWEGQKYAPEVVPSTRRFMHALRHGAYNACIQFRQAQLQYLKEKACRRRIQDFLLRYLVLHPRSRYIQRLANEFYES
jgi:hypothetical protein